MSSEDPQQPPPSRLPSVLWGEQKPGACLCAEAGEGQGLSANPNILTVSPELPGPLPLIIAAGDEPQPHRSAPTRPISPHPTLEARPTRHLPGQSDTSSEPGGHTGLSRSTSLWAHRWEVLDAWALFYSSEAF